MVVIPETRPNFLENSISLLLTYFFLHEESFTRIPRVKHNNSNDDKCSALRYNYGFCCCPSVDMTFIILFCLLLDHQVVAGVMEQRQLRSKVSTTRVGPSESSFHKIPETEDSTRNLPTNDSNKLVADQSTNTDTRGRINLTAAKETASISRPPADSKQSERRLKDRWVLKKTIRRNLMIALERKIASRISAMSPHLEASAADNTKRILRMKSETEAVFPRKASKHNRLHRKFSSQSRRVHSSADYFANALIFDTAYLKSDSRRNLGVVVAQQKDSISAKGIEPKRLVEKSRVYNSPLMVADSKAKGKGECLGSQAMDPELKSLSGLPSAFVDENVGMKKDETGFLHNFLNGESSNTEVQIDKKSKRVKREDITPAPGIDSTSAETTAGLAIVFGAEPNVTVAQHGIVEPNVTVAPHVTVAPNNSETTTFIPRLEIPTGDFRLPNEGEPLGVPRVKGGSAIGEEEPASEKDVEEKPIDSNGNSNILAGNSLRFTFAHLVY